MLISTFLTLNGLFSVKIVNFRTGPTLPGPSSPTFSFLPFRLCVAREEGWVTVGSGGGFAFQNCAAILVLVLPILVPLFCTLLLSSLFPEDLVCLLAIHSHVALAGSADTYLGLTLSASTATGGGLLYPPTSSLTAQILSALHTLYCVGFSYHGHHICDRRKLRIYLVCGSVCHAGEGIGAAKVSWRHSLLTFEEAHPTVL